MDDEEFEKRLNKEKSFINTTRNHTEELEKQLEEEKEEHKVRDEIEKSKEDYSKRRSLTIENLESTSSGPGILGALPSIIMSIVSIGIVLSVGLIVLGEVKDAIGTEQYLQVNSSSSIFNVVDSIPTWIGIIIIVALAFIVLNFFVRDLD